MDRHREGGGGRGSIGLQRFIQKKSSKAKLWRTLCRRDVKTGEGQGVAMNFNARVIKIIVTFS